MTSTAKRYGKGGNFCSAAIILSPTGLGGGTGHRWVWSSIVVSGGVISVELGMVIGTLSVLVYGVRRHARRGLGPTSSR